MNSCSSSLSIKRTTVNTESWKLINLIITVKILLINSYYNDPLLRAVTTCRKFTFLCNKAKIVTTVGKWPRALLYDLTGLTATATGLLTSHQLHLLTQKLQDLTQVIFLFADSYRLDFHENGIESAESTNLQGVIVTNEM